MSDFDPGPGWREVHAPFGRIEHETVRYDDHGTARYWVREAPVPPLPTAPYTVIRVTWKRELSKTSRGSKLMLDGTWQNFQWSTSASALFDEITSFEVLSEPRAVTAKAVLKAVAREEACNGVEPEWPEIARDFKVES